MRRQRITITGAATPIDAYDGVKPSPIVADCDQDDREQPFRAGRRPARSALSAIRTPAQGAERRSPHRTHRPSPAGCEFIRRREEGSGRSERRRTIVTKIEEFERIGRPPSPPRLLSQLASSSRPACFHHFNNGPLRSTPSGAPAHAKHQSFRRPLLFWAPNRRFW